MGLSLNNAELLKRGQEPLPGEAKRLYVGVNQILENQGEHHTKDGKRPKVVQRKIKNFIFEWSCTAVLKIPTQV